MQTKTLKNLSRFTVASVVLATGIVLSSVFAPAASAFQLGSNGEITIFRDAEDNPEGKSDLGRYFWVIFDGSVNGTELNGLTSGALFRVDQFQTTTTSTNVALSTRLFAGVNELGQLLPNVDRFQDYRVSVLGFSSDPNITSSSVDGTFNTVSYNSINANGGIDTEICFKDGGGTKNCNGGGSGGVQLGDIGSFTISLTLAQPTDRFTLSNFGVRYQDIDSHHYNLRGDSGTGEGQAVPEPFTILGTGTAIGFGGLFRREQLRRQRNAKMKTTAETNA